MCDVLFKDIAKFEEEFFHVQQIKLQRESERGANYRGRGGRGNGRGGHDNRNDRNAEGQGLTEEELAEKASEQLNAALAKCGSSIEERKNVYEKHVKEETKRQREQQNDNKVKKYVDRIQLGK